MLFNMNLRDISSGFMAMDACVIEARYEVATDYRIYKF